MIIVRIKGGLGNQMFQYAVGRSIALRTGNAVQYDLSSYIDGGTAARDTFRELGLEYFNVQLPVASPALVQKHHSFIRTTIRKIQLRLRPGSWYSVDARVLNPRDGSYLEGWWQTEQYFSDYADTIRAEFSLKKILSVSAQSIHLKIKELTAAGIAPVSLHVRRGDYVSNIHAAKHHGLVPLEYYHNALEEIKKNESKQIHIFVFSDDIEWAKTHIKSEHSINFVSSPEIAYYEELYLMSTCAHHIIANSTFSWWGAWLNPSDTKIVIAPKQWVISRSVDTTNATPAQWIRL